MVHSRRWSNDQSTRLGRVVVFAWFPLNPSNILCHGSGLGQTPGSPLRIFSTSSSVFPSRITPPASISTSLRCTSWFDPWFRTPSPSQRDMDPLKRSRVESCIPTPHCRPALIDGRAGLPKRFPRGFHSAMAPCRAELSSVVPNQPAQAPTKVPGSKSTRKGYCRRADPGPLRAPSAPAREKTGWTATRRTAPSA